MKKSIIILLVLVSSTIINAQSGTPPTRIIPPRIGTPFAKKINDTTKIILPGSWNLGDDSTYYFWNFINPYNEVSEVAVIDEYKVRWAINGKEFTEVTRSAEPPKYKNPILVYVWRKGENNLIVTLLGISKVSPRGDY
jgi:hypothetical protein